MDREHANSEKGILSKEILSMGYYMARENLCGPMAPSTRVNSETTRSLGWDVMIGQMEASMKDKLLTVSDMAKELTLILKKE